MYKAFLRDTDPNVHILEHKPQSFSGEVKTRALEFAQSHQEVESLNHFKMSEELVQTTGTGEVEKRKLQEQVEALVIERLKVVEESAYKEAYSLGMTDGHKKAFEETRDEIKASVDLINESLKTIMKCKEKLLIENEAHIVHLALHMAAKIAFREITMDPKIVGEVIKKALESAASEEDVTIKLNTEDYKFLETTKEFANLPLEKIKNLKIEPMDSVGRGGCILETNYGVVDASIEKRVAKLWSLIDDKVPRVNTDLAAEIEQGKKSDG